MSRYHFYVLKVQHTAAGYRGFIPRPGFLLSGVLESRDSEQKPGSSALMRQERHFLQRKDISYKEKRFIPGMSWCVFSQLGDRPTIEAWSQITTHTLAKESQAVWS